ncbi:hypothetical protein LP420_35440 [Massilia sp. B-10]|nr:hypothetical protein LP420_35440 [Massilia sp. B-10]
MCALEPISILLSDAPIVDAAQRFYHRILLGESELIIRDALAYLRNFQFRLVLRQRAAAWPGPGGR